jgi:protein gp37
MSTTSKIEWTEKTWNPSTGCDRLSPGCDHCYALTLAKRLKGMGQAKYQNDGDPRTSGPGFGLTIHPDALDEPLRWRKPTTVFVNSMSDLFHARVPREFIAQVWDVMQRTPQHTYQVLTKRPERLARVLDGLPVLENVWLGTSIESDRYVRRADHLRAAPAAVRFISAEPLLAPLSSLNLAGIDWLIAGGESGPGVRPMDLDWVRHLLELCEASGTAPFVKQLGSVWASRVGADKKGGDWSRWPAALRVREYPRVAGAVAR